MMSEVMTPEMAQSGEYGYIHNTTNSMDIAFDDKQISVDKIKADGYDIGVNHRPLRTPHVNKIKDAFIGDSISIRVVFDSRDSFYHIIQGQHLFTACLENSRPETIMCGIIMNKSTGNYLDACNKDDRDKCFEYSYRSTEGQEQNCIADRIGMVTELSEKYKEETGQTWGCVDYVYEHQYGSRKLSRSTIKLYSGYGIALKKHNSLIFAQKEHWDEKQIKAKVDEYKLKKKKYKSVNLRLEQEEYDEFISRGFNDVTSWKRVLKMNNKQTMQQLLLFSNS